MDDHLRTLERLASRGDEEAAAEWTRRMVSLGRIEEIPVGNLRYLDAPGVNYHNAVVDLVANNPALAGASLSYWARFAGEYAFCLHQHWAGGDAFGPRRTPADRGRLRDFAMWARAWVSLLFMQSIASGDDPVEVASAYDAALLAGGEVSLNDHEELTRLPGNPELDAMIVAMHG